MPLGHPADPLLPVVDVPNFTGSCKVEITGDIYAQSPLVHVTQSAGSMRFTHSMTLEQADKMASGLRLLINSLIVKEPPKRQ